LLEPRREWGLETRFEILAAVESLAPLGLMKLRASLSLPERARRGEGSGRSAASVRGTDSFPGCRVALCSVKPSPSFAQTHEEHKKMERFNKRHDFTWRVTIGLRF
jgi:hypothetical protein